MFSGKALSYATFISPTQIYLFWYPLKYAIGSSTFPLNSMHVTSDFSVFKFFFLEVTCTYNNINKAYLYFLIVTSA